MVQMTIGGLVGMPAVCEYGNCKVCCFADGIKALRRVFADAVMERHPVDLN